MDSSTDGVMIPCEYLFDIVEEYRDKVAHRALSEKVTSYDRADRGRLAPMSLYNELCDWVESNLGPTSIQRTGAHIGERTYQKMIADGRVMPDSPPIVILEELKRTVASAIRDPKRRGWEIVDQGPSHVTMRRTQSFNCLLQEGVLRSLVENSGVRGAVVSHDMCTRRSDGFCEYGVRWRG